MASELGLKLLLSEISLYFELKLAFLYNYLLSFALGSLVRSFEVNNCKTSHLCKYYPIHIILSDYYSGLWALKERDWDYITGGVSDTVK